MTLQEKREARAKAIAAAKALRDAAKAENRDLTPEEVTKAETHLAEADRLKEEIARDEAQANLDNRISSAVADMGASAPAAPLTGAGPQGLEIPGTARVSVRPNYNRRSMRAFVGRDGTVGERDEREAFTCGMFLAAALADPEGETAQHAQSWCRARGIDWTQAPATSGYNEQVRLAEAAGWLELGEELGQDMSIRAAAQTGQVNQYGGATTPTLFSNRVLELVEEYGVFRREINEGGGLFPMASDTLTIPRRTGGLTVYHVNDSEAATESRTSWTNVNLVAKEFVTLTRVPISLMEDSIINWADRIAVEIARAFAQKEDNCIVDGDGTSTYGGITGFRTAMVDGNHTESYVDATAGDDQFAELILADFFSVVGKLLQFAGLREKWYISKLGWATSMLRLLHAQGGATATELSQGSPPNFLGYDVVRAAAMPKATSAYNELAMLFYGDVGMAGTFGDRRQVTVRRSDQRYFEYGQVGILGSERFDFVPSGLGDNTTGGALVALRGNTA